jgi:hypothetical protein
MKDLLIIYTGVYASLISSNFHIFVSNLLAITTIIYTLVKFYLMYQDYKNKK